MKCPRYGYPSGARKECNDCSSRIKEGCVDEYQERISQEEAYDRIRDGI